MATPLNPEQVSPNSCHPVADRAAQDRLLAARIAQGDNAAFDALFCAYRDDLGAFVMSIVGTREAAEEIVHDLFLRLWGGPYPLIARKIGYAPAQWPGVEFHGNDTLRITFRLPLAPAVLPAVVTTAKGATAASRRITAAQFDPAKANNALFVLGRYRPDMLGDPTVCAEPPQPIWRQQEQSQAQAEAARLFGAGTFSSRGADATPRRWWLDSLYNARTDPYSPHVLRVYVNGIRRDYPGQSPLAVLRYIPADQVKEMYYADCKDTSVPIDMRYSIFVVLKPPSLEEQQQVLRRLMLPDSARAQSDTASAKRDAASR